MPSKKPRIQAVIEEETREKFKKICELENRTESNLAGIILTKYVKEYEANNGTINTITIGQDNNGTIVQGDNNIIK